MVLFYAFSLLFLNLLYFIYFEHTLAMWESEFKLQEGILAKLRFRDHELRIWHISKRAVKNSYDTFKINSFSWITEVIKSGNTAGFFFPFCWLQFVVIFWLFFMAKYGTGFDKTYIEKEHSGAGHLTCWYGFLSCTSRCSPELLCS